MQVLRPSTRQKVMILGRNYRDYLSNNLESVPSFLGGNCSCSKCSSHSNTIEEEMPLAPSTAHQTNDNTPEIHHHSLSIMNPTKKPLVKIIVIGVVMVWILFAIILGTHYSEWVPPLYWRSHS